MEITQTQHDDLLVVHLNGRLDAHTAKIFEDRLLLLIAQGRQKILVDFSKLDYISSAGLRVLLLAARKLSEAGGKIALCCLKPMIKTVFDIAGFSAIFPIFSTFEEGQAVFGVVTAPHTHN
ncbi:MAG: putative anti-sigma factor antagonist BtrV [bacterium]|nr:putative anti-sigma factor antagonist BtrV [bacterium]